MTTIYIDMDSVVADWEAFAREILGITTLDINGRWPNADWQKLRSHRTFYRNLPKMPKADELMDLARKFRDNLGWDLFMLTAIPHNNDVPEVYQHKIEWQLERYPDVMVHFGPYSFEKKNHCKPGDVLVDDRTSNCEEWRAAGGIAIQVTRDYDLALRQLEELYRKQY